MATTDKKGGRQKRKAPRKVHNRKRPESWDKILEAASKLGFDRSIQAICDEAGVDRKTYYKAMDREEFRAEWEALPQKMMVNHIPGVYAAMLKKAKAGDVAAGRLVLELIGHINKKGDEPKIPVIFNAGTINNNYTPEQNAEVLDTMIRSGGLFDRMPVLEDGGNGNGEGSENGNGRH